MSDENDQQDESYEIEFLDTGEDDATARREAEEPVAEAVPADEPPPARFSELQEENRKLRDQYMRHLADFDNFRKRAERDRTEFRKYALADVLRSLLPVIDNFERALAHDAAGADDFRKGIELIYKQLSEELQKAGLRVIEEAGVPFDPTMHEAVIREHDESVPDHTVLDVMQKGYFLHDRLLRPAMVKVSTGGPASHEPAE